MSKPLSSKPLPIVEVFGNTLQGEGPRLHPAIFVRTALCNFRCTGFACTRPSPQGKLLVGCDTLQAVSPRFKETWTYYEKADDLIDRMRTFLKPHSVVKQDIIVTGGEPCLHWHNQVFQDLLAYWHAQGHHITIESNGTQHIDFFADYHARIMFSLSVKLPSSGEPKEKRFNLKALKHILENSHHAYLKLVVSEATWEEDFPEIVELVEQLPANTPVYLMPMGETREKQIAQTRFVVERCAQYGFNFSPRIHILAFDDQDGV